MSYVNQATYDWTSTFSDQIFPPSLTVPGMVMTMQEIVARYTRGQAVPSLPPQVQPAFDSTEYDKMDVFQRIDYQRALSTRISTLRDYVSKQKDADARRKAKEEFDAAVTKKAAEIVNLASAT